MKKIMLSLFCMLILLSSLGLATTDFTINNKVYYSFDVGNYSGTNIYDLAGNFNSTKKAITEPIQSSVSIINESVDFDGTDDYITVSKNLMTSSDYTMSAWINSDNFASDQRTIFNQYETSFYNIIFRFETNGKLRCYQRDTSDATTFAETTSALNINTWYYVTCNYNTTSKTLGLYINGVLNDTDIGANVRRYDVNGNAFIGNQNGENFFDGNIDEFSLWNYTLQNSEILEMYNLNLGGSNPYSPVAPIPSISGWLDLFNETPTDGLTYTTNSVQFNITMNTSNTTNCSFYIDNVSEYTLNNIVAGNGTALTTTHTLDDGNHSYYWFCNSNSTLNDTSSTKYVLVNTLDIGVSYPSNNTQFNTNIVNFNTTVNSTIGTFQCLLDLYFLNGTTDLDIVIGGGATGTDLPISYDYSFGAAEETSLNYTIQCKNSNMPGVAGYEFTDNKTIYVDFVYPAITISSDWVDKANYYQNNVTMQINFTDDFSLFSWNVSLDGVQLAGANIVLDTFAQYNLSQDTTNMTTGNHEIFIRAADGHTAKALKGDYKVSDGLFNNYLEYEFFDKGYARIQGDGFFDRWETKREKDRYSFDYKPSDKKKNKYTFTVDSDLPIHLMDAPNTPWKQWLVMGDHWLDFYMLEDVGKAKFKKINDYKYEVTITGITKPDKLKFSSIGDLNIVNATYNFSVANVTMTYSDLVLETEDNTISVLVEHYGNISESLLYYNNTLTTTTNTSTSTTGYRNTTFTVEVTAPYVTTGTYANVTINYNVTLDSLTMNLSELQQVYKILIDNCSTYDMQAINFTLLNQSDDTALTGDIAGYFQIWLSDSASFRAFNLSWDNVASGGLCIFPNSSTYNVYSQMEYGLDPGTKFTYYMSNTTINNVSDTIPLYITDSTTEITLTVTDENDNNVENAFISILRYDLPTDSYVVTEIVKTDTQGVAIANLIQTTQWYKFIITYNNIIYLETSPTKILTSTYNFQIVLGSDYYEKYTERNGITCNVAFNNVSKCFSYTASDPTGNSNTYCLDLYKRTLNSNSIINNSCEVGASATINLCVLEATGDNTYEGRGSVTIDDLTFTCDSLDYTYSTGFRKYGKEGLFVTFLMTLTMVMIGIWSPVIAIILMTISIILSIVMGIFQLTWSVLIGFIILAIITIYRMNQ